MAEMGNPVTKESEVAAAAQPSPTAGARSKEEIALDLLKFVAVTTGYGRGSQAGAGFSGKPGTKSPEEQADALLDLFQRCRAALKEE
jgi:hypothetical protein